VKKLLLLGGIALFIGTMTIPGVSLSGSPARQASDNIRNRFIGAWWLVWLEEPDASGKIHKADCTGLLVYTRDGHMSVQVMYRNPQAGAEAGPVKYAQSGYEASYGTFKIKDAHTFTYHVDGALLRSLVGRDFNRVFELSSQRLIVKSPDPNEHWRVAWEHY
jgi:Lipocalin-like domain